LNSCFCRRCWSDPTRSPNAHIDGAKLAGRSVDTGDRNARDGRRPLGFRKPEDIIVASGSGLKYLPGETAFGKAKAMVDGARIVRAEFAAA
jgi:5-methyltetrahydropteroyltriglutamate--homocysteine methyltransferase